MKWKRETLLFLLIAAVFLGCYFLPVEGAFFDNAVDESLRLVRDYARQHVLLCLVPAFFIAGAIAGFVRRASVMKYLGAKTNKVLAYSVASVSGAILAVCSCTVLPLFAGIYRMGAGLGPATTFLYSGPAINVLAIILTWRLLGWRLGLARAVGAVIFSIVIGLLMHLIFRKEQVAQAASATAIPEEEPTRPLWKTAAFFAAMVAVLVFANWARSGDIRATVLCCPGGLSTYQIEATAVTESDEDVRITDLAGETHTFSRNRVSRVETQPAGWQNRIHAWRWMVVAAAGLLLTGMIVGWFRRSELTNWVAESWSLAKQIFPLLFLGVLAAGLLLGRPGSEGLIPSRWIEAAVGGNSPRANLLAAAAGALMYFATLTEVPILQGLLGAGMGKGPALALLLAGPALSLPNMLVIRSVIGTKKTLVYVLLVVVMAAISGILFGTFF
jgi:uncharacterized membrane protein YraQ (UPF0718 family)